MIFDELVKSASEFPVAVNAVRNPDVILKHFFFFKNYNQIPR